jgi:hypothetical protein
VADDDPEKMVFTESMSKNNQHMLATAAAQMVRTGPHSPEGAIVSR